MRMYEGRIVHLFSGYAYQVKLVKPGLLDYLFGDPDDCMWSIATFPHPSLKRTQLALKNKLDELNYTPVIVE